MSERHHISILAVLVLCFVLALINISSFKDSFETSVVFGSVEKVNLSETDMSSEVVLATLPNSINFVGDIMLARDVESYLVRGGSSYPFKNISYNKKLSYTVGNFEAAVAREHKQTPNNTFRFSVNSKYLEGLHIAGFTHLSLANNHSFDYGLSGYNQTVTTLWDANLTPFGHPTILSTSSVTFLPMKDKVVSIIATHTLFAKPKSEDISSVFAFANAESDIQVVYVHWGDEYQENQSLQQRKFAKELIEAGADIIIGHHPHVVQGIEKIDNALVFYSLGNFIFDQYFSESVQNGLLLNLDLEDDLKITLVPVSSIGSRAQPYYQTEELKKKFLTNLAKRSSPELTKYIAVGTIPLQLELASSTEVVIMAE